MDITEALKRIENGDRQGLARLVEQETAEGVTAAERREMTRMAARCGQAGILRDLFEKDHLYETDADENGRTLLHDAAGSGDPETIRFAMDVAGFDPLRGDARGRTPLEEAAAAGRKEGYVWLTERLGFTLEDCYRNPVIRGFHPDPSVVRVGEDYYLVNSSFVCFPGLPVFHSRDLVHWRQIGHAVENLETSGLTGLPGGFGYWAPDISYYKGEFWVVATLRRDTPPYRLQMITSAERPEGPWAAPRFLPLDGIDPSLFADGDRRYILLNPGAMMAEISEEGELRGEAEMIYFGDAKIKPEGPHLLKKDGWYYLFLAEGGTGDGHMETVMRSRNLKGPYAPCPFNPILGKKQEGAYIQRSGHGKPVSTPDGRWYMVYLCGRKTEGRTVMGRETALDPMTWTADGWPMVNGLKGPSCLQVRPDAELKAGGGQGRNDAETAEAGRDSQGWNDAETAEAARDPQTERTEEREDWIAPRTDPKAFAEEQDGAFLVKGGADPAGRGPCSLLLCRQREAGFRQSAEADLSGCGEGSAAGLAGYYDERSFFLFLARRTGNGLRLEAVEQIGEERKTRVLGTRSGLRIRMAVTAEGLTRHLWVAEDETWKELGCLRTEYLSDEGLTGGKRFTGALLGMAAIGEGTARFEQHKIRFEARLN